LILANSVIKLVCMDMTSSAFLFIYLLAGITFAFAAISITIGLQKGSEKMYFSLGLIGVCTGVYHLLFPHITIAEPLSLVTKVGFFFFLTSFSLLPWFFRYYTGYRRLKIQWLLTIGMLTSYVLFIFTSGFGRPVVWNILAHIVLTGIIIFGFKASIYQKKRGDFKSARWLLGALMVFSLLTIDDIVRMHFPGVYPFAVDKDILPLDYFLVLFMITMGLKLVRDIQLKNRLEKSVIVQKERWGNLLDKVQLLVVDIDRSGNINYVNPFFLGLTGFRKEDILNRHYMQLIPDRNKSLLKDIALYVDGPEDSPYYQNHILTRSGDEKAIAWSLVGIYDETGKFVSSISIGSDITERERAYAEIALLKAKLEEENVVLKAELSKVHHVGEILGNSDAIRYVLQRALQVSPTDATVLLEGETGVGKELVANYVQQYSNRKHKPFIKINCATIPATLLESELFGHVKGAFTGADRSKRGLVEIAHGGTLFLDEIGEFPIELQAKLLRFLQEGEYMPLGSETPRKSNVRIIAATNRNLLELIEEDLFRNDLYYRLYVYPITIPALRSRAEDIPEFVEHFVQLYARKHYKSIKKVSRLVVDELTKYHWPGNVRELENILERAVIVSDSDTIKLKDISLFKHQKDKDSNRHPGQFSTLERMEREHITTVLQHCNWQVHGPKGAGQILGINPNTLRSRMKKLGISKP